MPKLYTQLEIAGDEQLNEQLIAVLSQLGFEGFWEEGTLLRCYMKKERWSDDMLGEIRRVAGMIQRASSSAVPAISVSEIEEQNWNAEWEKTIQPIRVTDRIVITPTWHEYSPASGEIVLVIDPKMSFGTGYHETTRLVLRMMETTLRPGVTLLDIGTGTGVLAIAAIKLGAASAIGVDNDEWSYENARENVRLNGVEHAVQILAGELSDLPRATFSCIVANIQRNVLQPLVPEMKQRLASGGALILSGLLTNDEEPMRAALNEHGFAIRSVIRENEWVAMMATGE